MRRGRSAAANRVDSYETSLNSIRVCILVRSCSIMGGWYDGGSRVVGETGSGTWAGWMRGSDKNCNKTANTYVLFHLVVIRYSKQFRMGDRLSGLPPERLHSATYLSARRCKSTLTGASLERDIMSGGQSEGELRCALTKLSTQPTHSHRVYPTQSPEIAKFVSVVLSVTLHGVCAIQYSNTCVRVRVRTCVYVCIC
jgi:hypothetical protein